MTARVRALDPPPQDAEHAEKGPHFPGAELKLNLLQHVHDVVSESCRCMSGNNGRCCRGKGIRIDDDVVDVVHNDFDLDQDRVLKRDRGPPAPQVHNFN